MPLPTCSGIDDLALCGYRFRPGLDLLPDVPSVGGLTGTLFHSLAEAHNDGRDPLTVPHVEGADGTRAWRMFAMWRPWWDAFWPGLEWVGEIKYAISLTTGVGRRLRSPKPRDYSEAERDEVPGTADAIGVRPERVVVADYKTGRLDYVTPARDSLQLRTLALAATRTHGLARATAIVVHVSDLSEPIADEVVLDAYDLDSHEDRLREMVAGIATSEPTSGPHCRFCLHRHACPEAPKRYREDGRRRLEQYA